MFRKIIISFVVLSLVSILGTAASGQIFSIYTDLSDTKCRTLEIDEEGASSYRGDCGGVFGYKLHVIEGDLRQTIDIISPDGKTHELQFWNFFGGFSAVGPRAEWRIRSKKPIALIVRLNVSEDPEDSSKTTSYLIVAKITENEVCVTDILKPTRSQNIEARRSADRAAAMPCKKPYYEQVSDMAFSHQMQEQAEIPAFLHLKWNVSF
ncbi:MAG TPA: hypothetical protein PKD24_14325 [Pyrinomonadaceae bacterium]|nr:hypothetical protein [Pyrinomonadaceae bacterium]HMP66216.1 hypothetical protein [Pyrinomonadaceae bacterium]